MADEASDSPHWISEEELVRLLRARAPDISWVKDVPDLTLEEIKAKVALLTPEQRAAHEATIRKVEAEIAHAERHQEREDEVRGVLQRHGVGDFASGFSKDEAFDLLQELMDKVREWTTPTLVPDAVTLLTEAVEAMERTGCQFDMCPGSDVEPQDMMTCYACATVRRLRQALASQPDPFSL